MAVIYEKVVPWGRNYDEYSKMFNLTDEDLSKKILGCGDGPASFNAEGTEKRFNITSVDPIYCFTKEEIEKRIEETYELVLKQTRENSKNFLWKEFKNVEELAEARMKAMKFFLSDYEKGLKEKRYIQGELPNINFLKNTFDLTLCSHFLFLYSDNLTLEFHIESIEEMLKISKEVRIFPIIDNNLNLSKHYDKVVNYFNNKNFIVQEEEVEYEIQKGGNKMLKILKK